MAPTVPLPDAVLAAIAAAPNQRITHQVLAEQLRAQDHRNFGRSLMNMSQNGQIVARTEIENDRGVLYYSLPTA